MEIGYITLSNVIAPISVIPVVVQCCPDIFIPAKRNGVARPRADFRLSANGIQNVIANLAE